MDEKELRIAVKMKLQGYLDNTFSINEVSSWALEIIKAMDIDSLPENLSNAIHTLFDLHDESDGWTPNRDEIEKCLRKL